MPEAQRYLKRARCTSLRLALLLCVATGPARADETATPLPAVAPPTREALNQTFAHAAEMLLAQATYWQRLSDNDRSASALVRLLNADPDNADALALLIEVNAEQGKTDAARANLDHLRHLRPDDRRLPQLEQAVKRGPINPGLLARARKAMQDGRSEEAVAIYRQALGGDVPTPSLANEYYQALGGTDQGFQTAVAALGQKVIDMPSDLRTQLAYAQVLTIQDATRPEAIDRLTVLAQHDAVAVEAETTLRQSLLGLPNDPRSIAQLEAYAKRKPDDVEIRQKLDFLKNPPVTPESAGAIARDKAFAALKRNRLAESEAAFQQALAIDPDDPDATGGMGLIRQRQGRAAEARTLLKRAASLDSNWEPALRGLDQGSEAGNAIRQAYARVTRLIEQGDTGQAEQQLLRLMNGGGTAGNFVQLASIQVAGNRPADAEASFRRALALEADNKDALAGLATLLVRQGRDGEAAAMLPALGNSPQRQAIDRARADRLRTSARAAKDLPTQSAQLRQALALDPGNPWVRLDLAHALQKQHQDREARQVMGDIGTVDPNDVQAVQAALIFAQENGELQRAAQLVDRVPQARRTPDMVEIARRGALRQQIAQAMDIDNARLRRERLLILGNQPDPTGQIAADIARALLRGNDRTGAWQVLRQAATLNNPPTPQQRLAYAGALMEAGADADAERMLNGLTPSGLTAEQRVVRANLLDGLAIRQSDTLNQGGRAADAAKALAPRLAEDPDRPALKMAEARLSQSTGKPEQALKLYEAVLRDDSNNLDARGAAVDAAIAATDTRLAQRLAAEAVAAAPNDPRSHLMAARAARARGNNAEALREFELARSLRRQFLAAQENASP